MLTVFSVPLASLLDLSLANAARGRGAAPTAGLLALDRGRLTASAAAARVGSLLAEPPVRLSLGVALAAIAGPVGAAVAVVLAGWTALAVAHLPPRAPRGARRREPAAAPTPPGVIGAFLALAVVQNQDVLLANAVLPEGEAAQLRRALDRRRRPRRSRPRRCR